MKLFWAHTSRQVWYRRQEPTSHQCPGSADCITSTSQPKSPRPVSSQRGFLSAAPMSSLNASIAFRSAASLVLASHSYREHHSIVFLILLITPT